MIDSTDSTQIESLKNQKQFSIDLVSFYKVLQDDMIRLIKKSEREKWTTEQLIKELENLI
jgi:hypothetical protein